MPRTVDSESAPSILFPTNYALDDRTSRLIEGAGVTALQCDDKREGAPGCLPLEVQFSTSEGLSRGVVAFSPEAPDDPAPPQSVVLDDTSGPWSLALPADAIVDPEAVHDLWILVRYHVNAAQE